METHYFYIKDIQWDVDPEIAGLPSDVTVKTHTADDCEYLRDEEGPADFLSRWYGWAVRALDVYEIDAEEAYGLQPDDRVDLKPNW